MSVVWSNTGRNDDDDDEDDDVDDDDDDDDDDDGGDDDDDGDDDDKNNDVCSSVPSTLADISLYYHWKFGHDLWIDFYALNNLI